MALLESTKLERLRVIRDSTLVDRFEKATAEVTLTPGVDESVTGGATVSAAVVLTPGVDESTTEQRVGQLIDDFEDADLDEYSGDTSDPDVTVQGNVVDDGTYALQLPTAGLGSATDTVIHSTDGAGLDIYPEPGDEFESSVYITDAEANPVVLFGLQGPSNFYFARIGAFADTFAIGKVDAGTETEFDSTSATVPQDEWATIVVRWYTSGRIEAELKNAAGTQIASVSIADDTTFTDGGFGFAEAADFGD